MTLQYFICFSIHQHESAIETCIISYKNRIASPGSMQDTGCLGLVHWDDPERWYGEGGGRGFRMGSTCTPMFKILKHETNMKSDLL